MKSKAVWGRKDNVKVIVTNITTGERMVIAGHNTINGVGLNMTRDALNGDVTDLKIKYLAWLNTAGVEFGRKQITAYDADTNYQLVTTIYIAPDEANSEAIGYLAWYAGVDATATPGSGIEVARFVYSHTKTNLESLQCERVDLFSEIV